MAASPGTPLCPTWAFLNNCNVNVAKDRGWFTTYTPFSSTFNTNPYVQSANHLPVLGIGTVEIPTKRSPTLSGRASHGSVLLHDVLHVPNVICNILGQPFICDYQVVLGNFDKGKSRGKIQDAQGKNVAFFDPKRPLFTLKVRGPPSGPTLGQHTLQHGELYMLSGRWEPEEEGKWHQFNAEDKPTGLMTDPTQSIQRSAPYTEVEKAVLKKHWYSEYHFLVQHGLSIYDEENRDEGRSILRALMRDDGSGEGAENDRLGSEGDEEFEDDEFNLEDHQADYNFSKL